MLFVRISYIIKSDEKKQTIVVGITWKVDSINIYTCKFKNHIKRLIIAIIIIK